MSHRYEGRRYPTDIEIPNLDAMSVRELEDYAERTGKQVEEGVRDGFSVASPTFDWLRLASRYARMKVKATNYRLGGEIEKALRYERECDDIYVQIPKRMKW